LKKKSFLILKIPKDYVNEALEALEDYEGKKEAVLG
jgi:hypothetical protein